MVELSGSFVGVNLRNVCKSLCVLLPVLLFCVAAGAPAENEVPLIPEDSLRMVKEAEQYARELETASDGTEQGRERFMLAVEKLYDLGRIATPAVLSVIASNNVDPEVRKIAIEIVTDLRDVRALGPLVAVASKGCGQFERSQAHSSLARWIHRNKSGTRLAARFY